MQEVLQFSEPAKIFDDYTFIITQGTRKSQEEEYYLETETEDESDLNRSFNQVEALVEPSLKRRELKEMIENNGGRVLASFPGPQQSFPTNQNLVVLTDKACETMTFLLAIAYNYPRLHYQWVKDSVRNKILKSYRDYSLPVGYSTILKRDVEQPDIGSLVQLLKDMSILLTSEERSFGQAWKCLLTRIGAANVYCRTQGKIDGSIMQVDLIIADAKAPMTILEDAKTKRIPMVTSKWIIQSMINGKKMRFSDFKHPVISS